MIKKIYFLTLGCAKNEVDTSVMEGILQDHAYDIVDDPLEADAIFVNTCGFIESAKEESIDWILQLAKLKEEGQLQKLYLTGCLAQRYPEELKREIPEIDGILGPGYISRIADYLDSGQDGFFTEEISTDYTEGKRKLHTGVTTYVKIAEGCNNRCSYCIIPYLRGNNRSRKIEDIVEEVKDLVGQGTREVILVAQNSTDYGIDLYGHYALADLLRELVKIQDLKWIRILYAYPDHFTEDLIDLMAKEEKILPYLDMPLQHASNKILRAMNRKSSRESLEDLIGKLKARIDHLVLRSTFIVGFPGEEEEDVQELLDFIEKIGFDRLGVFTYSREENTKAYTMEGQVPEEEKEKRLQKVMAAQRSISESRLKKQVGRVLDILIEEKLDDGHYLGRSYLDIPEVDGQVYVESTSPLDIGGFYPVKIQETTDYDMEGVAL